MNKTLEEQIGRFDNVWHRVIEKSFLWNRFAFKGGLLDGVGALEISILSLVKKKPETILREVGKHLVVPPSTLTSAVDRLEKRGLLKRSISARDRRSYALVLTHKGIRAYEEHTRREQELFSGILGVFNNSEEREIFISGLDKVVDWLEAEMIDSG